MPLADRRRQTFQFTAGRLVADPVIPTAEFLTMAPEDTAQIAGEIVGFLLTKRQKVAGGLEA